MNLKRKILIAIDALNTGGEEMSVVQLLRSLDSDRYEVTLLTLHHIGPLFSRVPSWVRIVDVGFTEWGQIVYEGGKAVAVRQAVRALRIDRALAIMVKDRIRRQFCSMDEQAWLWLKDSIDPAILPQETFDFAMAYCSATQLHYLVATMIKAKRKAVWFHCEIDKWGRDFSHMVKVWQGYDVWAAAASDKIIEEYSRHFPADAFRLVKMPLISNSREMVQKASDGTGFSMNAGEITLFSVGRLNTQKGFDVAIDVLADLRQQGYRVSWYVAGEGAERTALKEKIKARGLQDCFILMGNLGNPFPYYRTCDIYVQPSRYEGYCLTLAEARAFAKPIVCTDFAGATEQVVDGETALVVPFVRERLTAAIKWLIDDENLRKRLSENLSACSVDSTQQISKIERMLDGASIEELRRST